MWKKAALIVGGVLALGVGAVLVIASTRPEVFRVERSIEIHAPASRIYPCIAELRQWRAWSPYDELDPGMQRTYSGAMAGVGAVYEWDGNDNVGAGRMEVVAAEEPTRIDMQLDFLRPFECHNMAVFTLEPVGDATRVTWRLEGPSQFVSNVISVFIDMDAMVGSDFEKGLQKLKALAEEPPPEPSIPDPTASEPAATEAPRPPAGTGAP